MLYSKILGWSSLGLVVAYIVYWNLKKDGQLSILFQEEKKELETFGKVELKEEIKAIYIGWSYAYHNPMQTLEVRVSGFLTPMSYNKDKKTIQNTFQKIIIIQLKNGQNLALIKELLPWQETKDLQYIGHIVDKTAFDYQFYIDSFPNQISNEPQNR